MYEKTARFSRAPAGRDRYSSSLPLSWAVGSVVKVRRPERFFRALPRILLARGAAVERIEPLDASAEAVFEYLVGPGGGTL